MHRHISAHRSRFILFTMVFWICAGLIGCTVVRPPATVAPTAEASRVTAPTLSGPDRDGDGFLDTRDNCPFQSNRDQTDRNGNRVGDACELPPTPPPPPPPPPLTETRPPDQDSDGISDFRDNCAIIPNSNQADFDGDDVGDVCDMDPDQDGDSIPDDRDNCATIPNQDQSDGDRDGSGDVCDILPTPTADPDSDRDTIPDDRDNCRGLPNRDQLDEDRDGVGDACDGTPHLLPSPTPFVPGGNPNPGAVATVADTFK
jgi:hypothetical protein